MFFVRKYVYLLFVDAQNDEYIEFGYAETTATVTVCANNFYSSKLKIEQSFRNIVVFTLVYEN